VTPLFELESVTCLRSGLTSLHDVGFTLQPGEFAAICGLNGAGKSTLLEIMSGLLTGYTGRCEFQGKQVRDWAPRALAQLVSFLPQSATGRANFTATEVVRMGRYPFATGWSESQTDHDICVSAMRLAGCEELSSRFINELSGGERQRVLFAAVLAQEPVALLLDEPGTFIDLPHQIQMFRTLRQLCDEGKLCVAATHDLNLAAAFASRIILLENGTVAGDGAPAELLPGAAFRRVFGEHVRIERDASGGVRVHYEL